MLTIAPTSIATLPVMGGKGDEFSKEDTSPFKEKPKTGDAIKSGNKNNKNKNKNKSTNSNRNRGNAPKQKPSSTNQRGKGPSSKTTSSNKKKGSSQKRKTPTNTSSNAVAPQTTERNSRNDDKEPDVSIVGGETSVKSNENHNGNETDTVDPGKEGSAHQSSHSRVLPERASLDVAQDTKRILEIVYGNTSNNPSPAKTLSTDEETDDSSTKKDGTKREKDDTKSNEKKDEQNQEEKIEVVEEQQVTTTKRSSKVGELISRFETDLNKKKTKVSVKIATPNKGKATPPKRANLPVSATSETPNKVKATPPKESNQPVSTKTKKRRRKRPVVQRDAAGKIVRRRKKGKGRDRVVRKHYFKKGKDAKIGLATIDETFYDFLSDSSRSDEWMTDEGRDDDRPFTSSDDSFGDSDDSDSDADDNDSELNGNNRGATGVQQKSRQAAKQNKQVKIVNRNGKFQQSNNEAIEVSLSNGVSSTGNTVSATNPSRVTLNNSRRSRLHNHDVENQNGSDGVVDTQPDSDNDNFNGSRQASSQSPSSAETTACTSTAEAENEREEKSICFFGSWQNCICASFSFVVFVAAATLTILYFVFYRENPISPTSPPSLSPSLPPVSTSESTQAPTTKFDTISTSCYLPDENQVTIVAEAEFATEQFGLATISNANAGYCGEGYVTSLTKSGSGIGFGSFKATATGFYKVAIRYNYAGKTYQSLRLQINDEYKGTFELVSTGNETSWLVDGIGDIALREGEQTISVWVDFHGEVGPNVDWLTLTLQKPATRYEYLTSLVKQSSDLVVQPTLTRALSLEWMSFEDPIDWSSLTDREIIERYALVQIYHATKGETWLKSNQWLSKSHVCSWYGVTCSTDMLVTDLILDENGLVGNIPAEISLLENLMVISLDDNELQGFIPREIGKLTNLSKIFLHANFLTGSLPSEVGWLEDLEAFDIGANFCFGSIPEEFFSLSRLETLVLRSNYLSGTLSKSVGRLKALKDLDVRNGNLSGTIPSELGELTQLTNLVLGYNSFTGTIPRELGLLQKLTVLDINSNELTGMLPPELSLLENVVIDYYGNDIVI